MKSWICIALCLAAAQASPRNVKPVLNAAPPTRGLTERIIGGSVASHGQFPYMADLWMNTGSFCGGSLISDTVVLTAAHCVEGSSSVDVYLGTQNLYQNPPERSVYTSLRIIMHPAYAWPSNDIALIILPQVALSSFVQPIRMPRWSDVGTTFVGTLTSFSGWGQFEDGSSISDELKFLTNVPVISNADCYAVYGSIVIDSHICSFTDNTYNGCLGDSGGPLVYSEDGQPTQLGVYAFISSPSCLTGPGGFTRVTDFLAWIESEGGVAIRP